MASPTLRRRLEFEDIGEVTIASFIDGKLLDHESLRAIREELVYVTEDLNRKKLVLNLSKVRDISSLALGLLVTMNKKLQEAGGKLVLCEIDPKIQEVFAIAKLDTLFVIRGDEKDALAAL
jgi:anti-anti-sigma factor